MIRIPLNKVGDRLKPLLKIFSKAKGTGAVREATVTTLAEIHPRLLQNQDYPLRLLYFASLSLKQFLYCPSTCRHAPTVQCRTKNSYKWSVNQVWKKKWIVKKVRIVKSCLLTKLFTISTLHCLWVGMFQKFCKNDTNFKYFCICYDLQTYFTLL